MNKAAKRAATLEGQTMTKHSIFLRKSSMFTLDVLAVLAGAVIAAPFALVFASPFLPGF